MTNRELDGWIAENVMGWKWAQFSEILGAGKDYWRKDGNGRYHFQCGGEDWNPTRSIAEAFQVVERMESCLHLKQHGKTGRWYAMFCDCVDEYVEAETASLVICLAAKKAVER
jgi:hypothetical protein